MIFDRLKLIGKENVSIFLLGRGELSDAINKKLESEAYEGLSIITKFEEQPYKILNTSKVFLSLQLYNNYPSKSLLEAMAAGNIPLVTDVGQTRWVAKPEFSYYIPEKFTSEELAKSITDIFKMDKDLWKEKIMAARQEVITNHTLSQMKDYYQEFYSML